MVSENKKKCHLILWLSSCALMLIIFSSIISAAFVRMAFVNSLSLNEKETEFIILFSEFPSMVKKSILTLMGHNDLLVSKNLVEKPHWIRQFPDSTDKGYLLLSGLLSGQRRSKIQLVRISDGKILTEWHPDWDYIASQIKDKKFAAVISADSLRALHPLLLINGDLIFNTTNALVRISGCNSKTLWVIDNVYHHSVEFDLDEKSVWVPSISNQYFDENPWIKKRLRDDSLARVSLDGYEIENISFSKILIENGLTSFLLGRSGFKFNDDLIHINQIVQAKTDSNYWEKGDLLISARNLSAVFLYRPRTRKIIWYQQGPWMNQHSALFVDTESISILDNNVYGGAPQERPFVKSGDMNRVIIYNFSTKKINEPFYDQLSKAKPITITEGRAQILNDGGLFFEESNFGRQLRFSSNDLRWSRINDFDNQHIGILSWSRYLYESDVAEPLDSLNRNCGFSKP